MARNQFVSIGGVVATVPVDDGDYAPTAGNALFDVYDAYTGGTQVTDLTDLAGGTITQVSVPPNTIPTFKGVDAYTGAYYLQDAANPSAQRIPAMTPAALGLIGTGAVSSVASKTGAVTLVSTDISDTTATGQAAMTSANAAALRTAAGFTTTGSNIGTAASTSAAQDAIGATSKGKEFVTAADAAAARTAIGATASGSSVITAANADAIATAAGGTTTGKALLGTASAVAARTTLSAPSQSETDLKLKAIVGSTAFAMGRGPIASRPTPGTAGLNDGDLWLETT